MHILIEILFQRQCPEANRKNLYCNYSFSLFCVFHVFWLFYFKAYINIEFGVRRCVKHFSRRHSSNNTMSLVLVIAGDPKISLMIKKVYVELLWKNCNWEHWKIIIGRFMKYYDLRYFRSAHYISYITIAIRR